MTHNQVLKTRKVSAATWKFFFYHRICYKNHHAHIFRRPKHGPYSDFPQQWDLARNDSDRMIFFRIKIAAQGWHWFEVTKSHLVTKESAGIQLEPTVFRTTFTRWGKKTSLPPQKILRLLISNKNVRPSWSTSSSSMTRTRRKAIFRISLSSKLSFLGS